MDNFDKWSIGVLIIINLLVGAFLIFVPSFNERYDVECLRQIGEDYCTEVNKTYYDYGSYGQIKCYIDYNPRKTVHSLDIFQYLEPEMESCRISQNERKVTK